MKSLHLQNMKLIIFDFDGTIADTSGGILDSHIFTLNAMEREIPSEENLRSIIGGNLLKIYEEKFDFTKLEAKEAVRIYRERYAKEGIHKAIIYTGFLDMILELKKRGYKIGVATLKAEKFARIMLDEMGIINYFDEICGMDSNDSLDKAGLILKCCHLCGCNQTETILIGDSENDYIGAQKAHVHFIGVTYGFGFKKEQKYNFSTANDCTELLNMIISSDK